MMAAVTVSKSVREPWARWGGCAHGRKSQRQGKKDLGPLGLKHRAKSYPR